MVARRRIEMDSGKEPKTLSEVVECAARLCEEMADEPDEPVSYESAVRCEALREAARRIRGLKDIPF